MCRVNRDVSPEEGDSVVTTRDLGPFLRRTDLRARLPRTRLLNTTLNPFSKVQKPGGGGTEITCKL